MMENKETHGTTALQNASGKQFASGKAFEANQHCQWLQAAQANLHRIKCWRGISQDLGIRRIHYIGGYTYGCGSKWKT